MSDTRDPAEEQQIADPRDADRPQGAPQDGEVAPAIDAAGIGNENPNAPELDDFGPESDEFK